MDTKTIHKNDIIWRRANNFPNYEVADTIINDDIGVVRNARTKKLVTQFVSAGYKRVGLFDQEGKQQYKFVHQLLVDGDRPSEKHTVDHIIAHKKTNNLSSNLRWATAKEQSQNKRKKQKREIISDYSVLEFARIPLYMGMNGYEASKTKGVIKTPTGRYLHGTMSNSGYIRVGVEKKLYCLHRLVCAAWNQGYKPQEVVNHKDNDRHNNDASNLEFCTLSQNTKAAVLSGKIKSMPVSQLDKNSGAIIACFNSTREAERSTGIHNGNIRHAANGFYKTAGGFVWEFTKQIV